MRPPGLRALLASALLAAAAVPLPTARADEAAARERADQRFEEGRRLLDEGKLEEACRAFEESQRLDPAAATLINLGDCYARTTRTASAWKAYREAVERASSEGDEPRRQLAEGRATASARYVSHLVVKPPRGGGRATVSRDGAPVPASELGMAVPVDPGTHTVTVTVAGRAPWSVRVEVPLASKVEVDVPLEPPAPLDVAPSPWSTAGLAVAGVGAASLVACGTFGLLANQRWHVAEAHCRDGLCDGEGLAAARGARRSATAATVLFVAGAVLGASGGLVWWRYRDSATQPAAIITTPASGPGATLLVEGRF